MIRRVKTITVLLTRSSEANESIRHLFDERGMTLLFFPTIEITDPDSWSHCDEAIRALDQYDGIFFTSKNAVERFFLRIDEVDPNSKKILAGKNLYAVGKKTADRLRGLGLKVMVTPHVFASEELVSSINENEIVGKRFLFPKGNIARDVIPSLIKEIGGSIDEIVVYRNKPADIDNVEKTREMLRDGNIDVITFFSPSSVRNFLQVFDPSDVSHAKIAVIGPTTSSEAELLGLHVDIVPEESTAESLVDAILNSFVS